MRARVNKKEGGLGVYTPLPLWYENIINPNNITAWHFPNCWVEFAEGLPTHLKRVQPRICFNLTSVSARISVLPGVNQTFYLSNMVYFLSQKDEDMEGDLGDVCINFASSNDEFHSTLFKLV